VGCGGKGVAAVVDPVVAPEIYLEAARGGGMQIRYVIDTHVHADHVSTARDLAARADAGYVLHASAPAAFPFLRVADGDRLELGNVFLEVLHMPGHTPEHLALLVVDRTRGPDVWSVFTGHTLMVGDMGRTELASDPAEGARALFASGQPLKALADFEDIPSPPPRAAETRDHNMGRVPVSFTQG
jgi:hydroxyacylglutathione hydrolase